jgi:ATP-dependent Clp protease ATP-binding subunit ClpA
MDVPDVTTRALIDAVSAQAGSGDPLVLLETAIMVAAETGATADAMVEHYVAGARAAELSWTVIGDRLGVSRQAARQRFAHRVGSGGSISAERSAVAPRLAACLEAAQAAADADDSVPGTQHLLLGLLHAGVAAGVLDHAGVTREKIRAAAARLFEPAVVTGDAGRPRRVVGDGGAESALAIAARMAARRGQSEVRTEHLLLELAIDDGASSRRVLDDLGVDVAQVKKELNQMLPPFPRRAREKRPRGKGNCDPRDRSCSFCGSADPARPMVTGPGVWICAGCVTLATDILATGGPVGAKPLRTG